MDALNKQGGVELVPFRFPSVGETLLDGWFISKLYFRIMGSEGNMHNFKQGLEGEDFIDTYKSLYFYSNIPNFLRPLVSFILRQHGQVLCIFFFMDICIFSSMTFSLSLSLSLVIYLQLFNYLSMYPYIYMHTYICRFGLRSLCQLHETVVSPPENSKKRLLTL